MRNMIWCALLLAFAACGSDKPDNIEPVLKTLEATDITRHTATLHGSVQLQGSTAMPQTVFKYGNGSTTLLATAGRDSQAVYNCVAATVNGLQAGTTYQYQLQSSGNGAKLYGNPMSFTTLPNVRPAIGDAKVLSHGPVSAIIGFDIADNGGEELTDAGCYAVEGSAQRPDDNAAKVKYTATKNTVGGLQWRITATGLAANTIYTFFPYAANSIGETTGSGIILKTNDAYTLSSPGDFTTLVSKNYAGNSISIAGPMDGNDLSLLRNLHLKNIDMTGVHIVSGGEPYNESYFSESNVVGQMLFAGCSGLESVSLPESATKIAPDAFKDCTALREVCIPSATIAVYPSAGCTSLRKISVSAANTSFKSIDGILTDAAVEKLVWFPMGKDAIPSLPTTIKAIGDNAFRGCNFTGFSMPDNITKLGLGVFYGSKLQSVKLPDKLAAIPTATFQQCRELKVVRLGSATELVSDYAFDGCPLTDLYVDAPAPPVCSARAFTTTGTDFTKTCTLHVPQGCAKYYRASKYWNTFSHIAEQP